MNTKILYWQRFTIGSQCKSLRTDVMWARRGALSMIRAAELISWAVRYVSYCNSLGGIQPSSVVLF